MMGKILRIVFLLLLLSPKSSFSFTSPLFVSNNKMVHRNASLLKAGGGRAPGQVDKVSSATLEETWQATPCAPDEARLTVIQITDAYTLEHMASVKTLLADTRAKSTGSKVISMITGDFLAPYLLSSVDRGQGMMNALAKIPIDYITWGNHEVNVLLG
jgi:2',3'-cyclic-nucleotide 2'-phosphodiesterase (5'-nucleotidase family)